MDLKKIIKSILPDEIYRRSVSALHDIKYYLRQRQANKFLRVIANKGYNIGPIKVGFIVQVPEIWDKEAPVFEAMIKDNRFDPYLLIVPSYDFIKSSFMDYGEELSFFSSMYNGRNIVKLFSDGKWLDLEKAQFDYIFYQRCWEDYIPTQYHTSVVIKFAKTCYIPYAVGGLFDGKEYYRTRFFASLYICFCSTQAQLFFHPKNKYRQVVFLGAPVLETFAKKYSRVSLQHQSKTINVLWTPRWTDDKAFGGSTFIRDMHNVIKLSKLNSNIRVILRPHPMTFKNAIKEKKLTQSEVDNYIIEAIKSGAIFDGNKLIEDSFLSTDILITDYSSIVLEYFLTGRPVVYCGDINVNFETLYKKISEAFYVVNNWEEVEKVVNSLVNGEDPLFDKRQKTIQSINLDNDDSSNKILDYIDNDYQKSKQKR